MEGSMLSCAQKLTPGELCLGDVPFARAWLRCGAQLLYCCKELHLKIRQKIIHAEPCKLVGRPVSNTLHMSAQTLNVLAPLRSRRLWCLEDEARLRAAVLLSAESRLVAGSRASKSRARLAEPLPAVQRKHFRSDTGPSICVRRLLQLLQRCSSGRGAQLYLQQSRQVLHSQEDWHRHEWQQGAPPRLWRRGAEETEWRVGGVPYCSARRSGPSTSSPLSSDEAMSGGLHRNTHGREVSRAAPI